MVERACDGDSISFLDGSGDQNLRSGRHFEVAGGGFLPFSMCARNLVGGVKTRLDLPQATGMPVVIKGPNILP